MVAIEKSRMFAPLALAELDTLRRAARDRYFEAGQQIFKEGDAGDGLYYLQDGRIEISAVINDSRRQVLSHIEPGEVFGEMAVIEDQPRSACARALADSAVQFITRDDIRGIMETSPGVALALLKEISRRLREFNRQHLREVIQAERLAIVGRFARSIIHDLKNPLNVIGLTAEIAGMDGASPAARANAVDSIRSQVDRISDMINEVLDFTHGTQPDVILLPVRYGQFVEDILTEVRSEAELKAIRVEVEGELPDCEILAHPKRLRRVFQNLIHNATEAMAEGGRIIFRARATPKEVVTEVEDSGPGIPPQIADSLFEPFATFGKANGTGLGLSICRRIIDDHKGWISARNEPGRGAVFSFGLPVVQRPPTPTE